MKRFCFVCIAVCLLTFVSGMQGMASQDVSVSAKSKPSTYINKKCNLYKTKSTKKMVKINGKKVSNIICKLKIYTDVKNLKTEGKFYKIKVNSKKGYVLCRRVSVRGQRK